MPNITKDKFITLACDLFTKIGASETEARTVAEVLLEASLSGYDSHGLMRIPRYVNEFRQGLINPSALPSLVKDSGPTALIDGHLGLGPVTAAFAVKTAADKAREFGVGCITTVNTNDIARLGSYLSAYGNDGLFMMMMANDSGTGAAVPPWGGTTPFLSTNPIAAVIPRSSGEPILIDVSTATTSVGKLGIAAKEGRAISPGVLIKGDGSTETDPTTFFQSPRASAILPLGGLEAGYKGFALSLICEALAGALGGSGCSSGKYSGYAPNGIFVLAVDPESFGGTDSFRGFIDGLVTGLKETKKLPSIDEILVPGERAARERERRTQDGIPVDSLTWDQLTKLADEFDLQPLL